MNDDDSAPSPVYCINCGAQAKAVANYCHDCGSPIYRGVHEDLEERFRGDALGNEDGSDGENTSQLTKPENEFPSAEVHSVTALWTDKSSASGTVLSGNQMSPLGYYFMAWKRYASFQGRSSRREFWYFFLFNFLALVAILSLEMMVGFSDPDSPGSMTNLYYLASFIPEIAVGVRRLHDTNRSGWWICLPVVNLVFFCQNGQPESNRYGTDPKGSPGAIASPENGSAGHNG